MPKTTGSWVMIVACSLLCLFPANQSVLAFTADVIGDYGDITVMEVSGDYDAVLGNGAANSAPREAIARQFYVTHPDDYDFLFIFTDFNFQMPLKEAVAFYMEVSNDVQGIGIDQFNNCAFFGSSGKLQGVIDMGNLANLASDPMDPDFSFTLGTMSHELMHRWGSFVRIQADDAHNLLGQDGSHWSFLLDTKGSLMYGNPWQDNRNGTFTSLNGRKYYCPLDLYLMGLADTSEVPPMLLIASPDTDHTQVSKPGVTIDGSARTVTIEDIIAVNGERLPDRAMSQKEFEVGCIFTVRPGTFKDSDLTRIRSIMDSWVVWHSGLTNGRSRIGFRKNPLESLPHNPGPGPQPHQPRPTPAEVEEAIRWLIARQRPDGSWSDSAGTTERDTAAAVRALKLSPRADTSVDAGVQWIGQARPQVGTDYLARMTESLVVAAASSETLFTELTRRKNTDGAWGPGLGYLSCPADTALALRALLAGGLLSAPDTADAVEFLKLSQNSDGGWGSSPHGSDIQATVNVLAAFAPLRVPYELNQSVQRGWYWLDLHQHPDGGFGENSGSVYDTAAVLEVLKTYDGQAGDYGPAIEYLKNTQSIDGSWHSSVFETALAAEALYRWKDSVDPDLVVKTNDVQISPGTITQTPESVTINVTVHNNGLSDAGAFYVDLYENTTAPEALLQRQSISLAGQSATTVQFVADFSGTQDRRLFIVADPENTVIETSELNNVALAILSNDLNPDPDLAVDTDDMYFSPAAVSRMPVTITLEALIHNSGRTEVPSAAVALYQDVINETAKVGERQVAVPALSSSTISFSFTVTDGDTHRYYLVTDPLDQISERNEYNNTAIKVLTSNPAYDFGLRTQDLRLSSAAAEMDQQVTITALVRNFGNRDGYNVPVRFYFEQEGIAYDIATLAVDLPAGGQVERQVAWKADRPGTALQVWVRVDPFDAFSEVSETNNSISAPLTVNPYPEPNLRITHEDIAISPMPALQGRSAAITASIANDGGAQADAVQVDFAWHKPGNSPEPLGRRTVAGIPPGQTIQAGWTIDPVNVTDLRHITVTVDPSNAIREVKEDDNSAFAEMPVSSLPDFIIHSSSISFDPWAPADGEAVAVAVAVQNAGGQAGRDVPIALYEDGRQIAIGTIAGIPGNSQASISFIYETAGKSGTHYLQAVVDPNRTILEQDSDNNTAGRTIAIQNSDLWLSQSYISANGDPGRNSTTMFFRLDQAADVVVVVVDEEGEIVRSFNGDELLQTSGGSITWDGRDERGALVPDGAYQIQVRDLPGNILHSMKVTVDNDLSPLAEAAGTGYISARNVTCLLPQIEKWQWFSDESGIIFEIRQADEDAPEYPPGVYTMTPSGGDIRLIVPSEWTDSRDPNYDYRFGGFALSPDDNTVAVLVCKLQRYGNGRSYEFWCMDRNGVNPILIDAVVSVSEDGTRTGDSFRDDHIHWSPDGRRLAYVVHNDNMNTRGDGLWIAEPDGTAKVSLPFENERSLDEIHWAPDGQRLCYMKYGADRQETYVVGALSGQTRDIFQVPAHEHSYWPQWIDATHFVFSYYDAPRSRDAIVVLDARDNTATEFDAVADGHQLYDIKVHPSREGFAFTSGPAQWSPVGDALLRYCDINGRCETLHLSKTIGSCFSLSDLAWSPLGDKLAFYDSFYAAVGENGYFGNVVVTDWASRRPRSVPVSYIDELSCAAPQSYHVWIRQNGMWLEQGALHYGADLETKSVALPDLTPDTQGNVVLRVTQVGTLDANVDSVALINANDAVAPSKAVVLGTGEDILQKVGAQDGRLAKATAATIEYEWNHLDPQPGILFQMHANEPNSPDSGPGEGGGDAGDTKSAFMTDSSRWLDYGRWLIGADYEEGLFALNAKTGEKAFFGLEWWEAEPSPNKRYVTQEIYVDPEDPCDSRGYTDLWVLKSLLNLTAELKIVRRDSYLELRGTAADRNFLHYRLEYSDAENPDTWHQIRPPVEHMVMDDLLIEWVPPRAGIYSVRMTAVDKVGHTAVDSRRVAWGLESPIADLYLADEYVSPNGDGIKDTLELHHTVREPVSLEFYISNQQTRQRVATLLRSYATVPADNGKAVLLWDGRDDSGRIVPDGAYSVEVLGYAYAFVIDNTPPDVTFELTRIETTDANDENIANACLRGITRDDHFLKWEIEHGQGDSPQEWHPLESGVGSHGSVSEGRSQPETIHTLHPDALNAMAGHKFRITVEDRAGNKRTAATERLEELLVLFEWKKPNQTGGWMGIPVMRMDDGSFGFPGSAALMITHLDTDRHQLKAVNTVRTQNEIVLQYRTGIQWHDGPRIQGAAGGAVVYEFPGRIPNLDSVNAVRLMAIDENTVRHYSNVISTRELFNIECVVCAGTACFVNIEVYPFEELAYLAFVAGSTTESAIIRKWDNSGGQIVPRGEISVLVPPDVEGSRAWVSAVGVSGHQYTERGRRKLERCAPPEVPPSADSAADSLSVIYPRSSVCSTPASGTIKIEAFIDRKEERELTKLAYYVRRRDNTVHLLRAYDLQTEPWGRAELDPYAKDGNGLFLYPEGVYPVWAVVTETVADQGIESEISHLIDDMPKSCGTGNPEDSGTSQAHLIVDRSLPQGGLLAPAAGVICPVAMGNRLGVEVQGTAHDAVRRASYKVEYGYGHAVEDDAWRSAVNMSGGTLSGFTGNPADIWDVTSLLAGEVTLRLSVYDVAGNCYCKKYFLNIHGGHHLSASVDKNLFSPNGDGILDEVDIRYSADKAVSITVTVLQNNDIVRTIASGLQYQGGTGELSWDGRDDGAQPVADGFYTIRVASKDSCANVLYEDIEGIEVDISPPAALIDYPKPSHILGTMVEVQGTATDVHMLDYTLALFDETGSELLQTLAASKNQVDKGILGRWNTYGIEGVRILKLTARDTAGNAARTQERIDLRDRGFLITDLSVSPGIFSPNDDGTLESVDIHYSLNSAFNENFNLRLEIVDANQNTIRAFSQENAPAGSGSFTWNGRNAAGQPVADGLYQAVLSASLASSPSAAQKEKISIVLDVTPPDVQIRQPLDRAFLQGSFEIVGSLNDANLEHYLLTLSGPAGGRTLQEGNVNRQDHLFARLKDPAEGQYTLTLAAEDRGGTETIKTLSITIDKTAPRLELESPQSGAAFGGNRPEIAIKGSVVEEHSDMWQLRYRLQSAGPEEWIVLNEGSTPPDAVTHIWAVGAESGVADGRYVLSLSARDKAGLASTLGADILIDNTEPIVSIAAPAGGTFIKEPTVIAGTADDHNLIGYTVEMAEGECGQAARWIPIAQAAAPVQDGTLAQWRGLPPDGSYCLRVFAEDAVQNGNQASVQVTVDTHPPAAPTLTGFLENVSRVHLAWTAVPDEDLSGYAVYRNGGRLNADVITAAEYIDTDLVQGTYQYAVRSVDRAGWESLPSNTVTLEVDLDPPAARILTPQNGVAVADLVTVLGTAYSRDDFKIYRLYAGEGAAPSGWQLIGQSPVPASYGMLGQWDTVALNSGQPYTLKLEAEDLSGNVGTHQVTVTVDNQPPAAPVLVSAVSQGSLSSAADVVWLANSEPDLAGYLLYRNDDPANAAGSAVGDPTPHLLAATAYTDANLPDGTYEYYLQAMDKARNLSLPSNRLSVTIDAHAPRATIAVPQAGFAFDRSIMVGAACPDTDLASIQFQYKAAAAGDWINLGTAVTAVPFVTYLDPVDHALAYGSYNLRAVATDKGGRTDNDPPPITVDYRDITPPAAPLDLAARVDGGIVTLTWTAGTDSDLAGYNICEIRDNAPVRLNAAPVTRTRYIPPGEEDGLPDKLYYFQVFAVDGDGNQSLGSAIVPALVYTPWVGQPFTPTATALCSLFGQAMAADRVEIFDDSGAGALPAGTVTADEQGFFTADVALLPGLNRITVRATDKQGNVSKNAPEVVVVHATAPAAPTGLSGEVDGHDCLLAWNPNQENDLAGYNLFRNGRQLNTDVLASGGTAGASVSTDIAGNARDGDASTAWRCSVYPLGQPAWWQLNLAQPVMIRRLAVDWLNESCAPRKFTVQAWTGYTWLPLINVMDNTRADNTFDVTPAYATDRIRLAIPADGGPAYGSTVNLSELRLWQADPAIGEIYLDQNVADGTHAYHLEAVNTLGMVSPPSRAIQVAIGDVTPPGAPVDFTAVAQGSTALLNWAPPADSDLAGYHIYRLAGGRWQRLTEPMIAITTYSDSNLANGSHVYRATAVDTVGNESAPSNEAAALVNLALPSQPINVTAVPLPQGGSINVCWEAVSGAAGYHLYRATAAGGPYTLVTSELLTEICYLDSGLIDGQNYFYIVHAVDALGNESAASSEAAAAPQDLVPPAAPILFAPTIAGVPISVGAAQTDIYGWAEPGAEIALYSGGFLYDTALSAFNDSIAEHNFIAPGDDGEQVNEFALSPDGRRVAYTIYDNATSGYVCRIYDIESGSHTSLTGYIDNLAWSPDGTSLAFAMDTNYGGRVAIYNIQENQRRQINAISEYFDERTPTWSPDGRRLLYVGNQFEWTDRICSYDPARGEVEQLADAPDGCYPLLSPDGRYLGYLVDSWPDDQLFIADLQSVAEPVMVADHIRRDSRGRPCAAWDPQGGVLAYIAETGGSSDIYTVDAADLSIEPRTRLGDITGFAWLPGRRYFSYVRHAENLWIQSRDGAEIRHVPGLPFDARFNGLSVSEQGRIGYRFDRSVILLSPAGRFEFQAVSLSPGENIFSAGATDAAGNSSPSSDPIVIDVDSTMLPDLQITDADLFHYPYVPVAGGQVLFTVIVRNSGFAPAANVRVDCHVWDALDRTEPAYSTTIPLLAAGAEQLVQFEWNSAGLAGRTALIVELDPGDAVFEAVEYNNMAYRNLYVAAAEGLFMNTDTQYGLFTADEDVNITVEIYNGSQERDVTLAVTILDSLQNPVAAVAQETFRLPYAPLTNRFFTWNTARTLVGDYFVRSVLYDSSGQLAENLVPFTIEAPLELKTDLYTDRQHYEPYQAVQIHAALLNRTPNMMLTDLAARIVVQNAAGEIVAEHGDRIDYLLGGASATVNTTWNTQTHPPGQYAAILTVRQGAQEIGRTERMFSIDEVNRLNGNLEVQPAIARAGTEVAVDYTVTHSGNVPVNGLPLVVAVVDPLTLGDISAQAASADIGVGGVHTGTFLFPTSGYAPGRYDVQLRSIGGQGSPVLAKAALTIQSGTQLPVHLSGTLEADPNSVLAGQSITLRYTVTNGGSMNLDRVCLRLAVPEGVSGDFQRNPVLPAGVTLSGRFVIPTAALIPDSYSSALLVTLTGDPAEAELAGTTFTVVAPEPRIHNPVAVSGGPYIAAAGEPIQLDGSGSFDLDEGRSASGEPPFDTITAYAWETSMVEPLIFDDAVGPMAELPGFDTPGIHPIALRVTDNTQAAFPGEGLPDLLGVQITDVFVYVADFIDLTAKRRQAGCRLAWTPIGAAGYEILRSADGPNRGFETIAATAAGDTTYLDQGIEADQCYWYRVRCVLDEEARVSRAVPLGEVEDEDSDGDGVADIADLCPGTPPGVVVDENGCCGEQLVDLDCPCEKTPDWRNHGAYVSCVSHSAIRQVAAGLITDQEKCALVSERARSDCGKHKCRKMSNVGRP